MPNSFVLALAVPFDRSYDFLLKFIGVCPENVWVATFGGWPVWQQVAHTLTAFDFFVAQEGQSVPDSGFPPAVTSLQQQGTQPVSKQALVEYAAGAKSRVDAYLATLCLENLDTENKGFTARSGKQLTHAATVAMLAAHTFYHLGSCDAALREQGLAGVF